MRRFAARDRDIVQIAFASLQIGLGAKGCSRWRCSQQVGNNTCRCIPGSSGGGEQAAAWKTEQALFHVCASRHCWSQGCKDASMVWPELVTTRSEQPSIALLRSSIGCRSITLQSLYLTRLTPKQFSKNNRSTCCTCTNIELRARSR